MSQQQSTAQIVLAILNVLATDTDDEHGMSLHDISARVGATDKTVRAHLQTLRDARPAGRSVKHLTRQWLRRNADSPDPTYGWCVEPAIDPAVARLIADGLTLARIDDDTLQEIIDDLRPLAGRSMRDDVFHVASLQASERLNKEFLVNVRKLDEAIDSRRRITYRYCAYDAHGELVPRKDVSGKDRIFEADPYRLFYKNGRYYLLCHRTDLDGLSYLYVDRFRDLHLCDPGRPLSKELDDFHEGDEPFDVERHLNEHPYAVSTRTVDVTMRVRHALEPVFDWFPDARIEDDPSDASTADASTATPSTADAGTADVTEPIGAHTSTQRHKPSESHIVHVRADEMAVVWWALQFGYRDRDGINRSDIEILEPAALRAKLLDAGRQLVSRYAH